MFSFSDRAGGSRREFLRVGSLGLGGSALAGLMGNRAGAAVQSYNGKLLRDTSVVFLFLHGGPSQIETFDPKPDAPTEYKCVTGTTPTSLPGVTFGSTFTKMAKWAHKLGVVRSFTTGNGNHDIKPIVCADTFGANMGSIYGRIAGTNRPRTGMPTNAALFPQSVEPKSGPAQAGFGKFESTGKLGGMYAPFVPGGTGQLQSDMKLSMPMNRLDDRRNLLRQLDAVRFQMDNGGPMEGTERFRDQAYDVLLGGISNAFDLSKEDPKLIEKYDTGRLVTPQMIASTWKNEKHYKDNAATLGKLMLLARRLCEAGAGFVTVTTNFVWDMHADVNNAPVDVGMKYVGAPLDHAVSTFIEDCEARGLGKKILLVVCGEMGRTPKINKKGGRDHWGNIAPLVFYGGGLNTGQVIGQSTFNGGEPATEAYGNKHLLATVMHSLIDLGELRLVQGMPTEIVQALTENPTIRELTE